MKVQVQRFQRIKRQAWLLLLTLGIGLIGVRVAQAQSEAAISGTVTDASGSTIPDAAVAVQNVETGAVRNVLTDSDGRYDAPLLPIGGYKVTVEKAGFKSESRTGITLVVGQRAKVDITLSVGEFQQTVTVTEVPETVAVSTEDTSGLVGQEQVKDLPLNGRSYDQLLTLNPGVVNYTSQRAGGIGTSNSVIGNIFAASGRRPQENLYLLNGVEYTSASEINNTPGGVSGQLLGVDAVREFSVVTDTYGAEYGKRPGAQINIVTASGTNQLHGNAYEFLRNSALDSRNYFDFSTIPPFERNVFGGSLGGPIKKGKTFLFGNYEGFRQKLGLSDVTLVPDSNARNGLLPCSALSTIPANCGPTTALKNVGVAKSIAPLFALWPAAGPEVLTLTGLPSGIAESFTNPVQHLREDFGSTRFDQIFSDRDSLGAFYTVDDSTGFSPTSNPFTFDEISLREQVASISETHVFTPSLLNRVTFGYSRGAFYFNSSTPGVNLPSWVQAGQPVGALVVGGGTTLNGASEITNGGTNAGSNLSAFRNLFTVTDQVTITHGKHLLDVGVSLERVQANDALVQDQFGQASFNNLQTFLAGTISTYTYAPSYTPLNWRSLEGGIYAEDTIKLKPTLELRIGFRGEFTNGWNEANGRASNYIIRNGVIQTNPVIGSSALATNNATFLPEPRIGIAWSPLGLKKTVIRAGFGMYYYLLDNLSYRLDQTPPFNTVYAVKAVTGGTLPFSDISPTANYSALGFNDSIVPSGVAPNVKTPTVESYSLKIEQEIAPNTSLSIGYVGSHGYHELLSVDQNLPSAAYPYPTQVIAAQNTGLANPLLWNSTNWISEGISSYNGLEVDVNHRIGHGLQFRGVYTFSKSLDDGDSMNTSVATNSPAFVANPLDLLADYGRASFDIRQSAVINATYDLPFGRSAASSEWVHRILGNWQISGIETVQSGLPFTPQLSYNPSNDGDTRNPVRPSWNPSFTGPVVLGGPTEYFNPTAFIQPTAGTYGNVGRNSLQGPGLSQTDFSLTKRILFTERLNLQFRSEFFNIFNHTNFNTPNPVVYTAATGGPSPTAGVITSSSTNSRQIQFGLKLLW
jgi:Carboxypeptidase regulatory-like domain